MDSIKSFKGYGKVDEHQQQEFRRKTRKRLIIIIVSVIVLVTVIAGVVVGTVVHKRKGDSSSDNATPTSELTPAASLKTVCSVTQYPASCFSSMSTLETANISYPEVLFKISLQVAIKELSKLVDFPAKLIGKSKDTRITEALKVCENVLDDALDSLNNTVSSTEIDEGGKLLSASKIDDMRTWLSTSMTDQETCFDALDELNSTILEEVRTKMENSTEFVSNSLAIVTKILSLLADFGSPIHRRLLATESGFPSWLSAGDRRLLQNTNSTTVQQVTVAKDGTGDFRTIAEAVNEVPKKSKSRFVIYVKEGVYEENVVLDKNKWNVMMYGDGKDKTIVSGGKNFIDGTPTFHTATFGLEVRILG